MTKELKAAVAKRRIAKFRPGWEELDLTEFTSIAEDAAELVAAVEDSVDLRNLEEISDTVAEIFSRHKGSLDLGGLKSLSVAAATSLAKHDGWLHMEIPEISDDAALALSKGIVSLKLTKLEKLDGTPGHIALARKLAADGTVDVMYYLENVSPDLLAAVPEFKRKK